MNTTPPPPLSLSEPYFSLDLQSGLLKGGSISAIQRTLGDLQGVFADENARAEMDPNQLAYRVQCHFPVAEGTTGGLFYGTSYLEPGMVGREYFMTKGHFHSIRDRAEYYWCYQGQGILLLMDESRKTWGEHVSPGSVHHIAGGLAHRLVNTGSTTLAVGACWPSDAGHDYGSIAEAGFSARVLSVNGKPTLVEASP